MEETGLTIWIVKIEEEMDERCRRAQYLLIILIQQPLTH